MATSFSHAQLNRFRREAKKLSREICITHSDALDRIAIQNGFTNWSLLSKHSGGGATVAVAEPPSPLHPAGAYRYYLHGDVVEDDRTMCYCARCDLFAPLDHLVPSSNHTDGKDGERFLSSLKRWSRLPENERGRKYRPNGAPNVLEVLARAERAARVASRSPTLTSGQRVLGGGGGDAGRGPRFMNCRPLQAQRVAGACYGAGPLTDGAKGFAPVEPESFA